MSTYPAAAWNVRVHRNPDRVAREVLRLLRRQDLKVLALVETHEYHRALRRALKGTRWRLVGYSRRGASARDSAVVVRRGLYRLGSKRLHRLGGIRWERRHGRVGLHRPRIAVSIRLKGADGPRVMAVHLPPTPRVASYPRRDLAHATALRRLETIGARWNRRSLPWVMVGDWNMRPAVDGSDASPSPSWLARRLRGRVTGTRIDYVLTGPRVRADRYRRGNRRGSDHRPILFDLTTLHRKALP